ncbi:MAG: glycoside hydrolase family 140 protein [Bacteroidota bacterium]
MKKISVIVFLMFCLTYCSAQQRADFRLKISSDGHSFQNENGDPFFWLGDTGWQMLARLDKNELEQYLENRRQKGFNVIQVVALDDSTDPIGPNRYGDKPLIDNDPDRPNEKYFSVLDWTLKLARKKGLYIGLLPTWAGNVVKHWGTPKAMFNEKNAYRYGLYLGKRYKDYPNVIWITGGDRPAFSSTADWRPLWRAMIKGIREGTEGRALITYHPAGESSSTAFWKDESTLDFNMMQSGHRIPDLPVWSWVERDFNLKPAKPILDGEPNYEDHPVNWKKENGYFDAYEVRKQLYRSIFSGAAGVTYGHHAVWQFYSAREQPIAFPDRYWQEALDRPGAFQAGYLAKLISGRVIAGIYQTTRISAQDMIKDGQGTGGAYIAACRDKQNLSGMVYLPIGRKIEIDISWLYPEIKMAWFNPRNGVLVKGSRITRTKPTYSFEPPTLGVGNDWVLILQNAALR